MLQLYTLCILFYEEPFNRIRTYTVIFILIRIRLRSKRPERLGRYFLLPLSDLFREPHTDAEPGREHCRARLRITGT